MNNSKYRHRKKSRMQKLKIRRRNFIRLIFIITLFFILFSSIIYKIYKKVRCQDLQYAVESQLTSSNSSESLLRVQYITLIFNDKDTAVVEVSGLQKDEPHYKTTIKATLKKDSFNSWNLVNSQKS